MKATEILKKCEKEGIKYLSLIDSDGVVIVPKNNPNTTIKARAAEIEKVLAGDMIPDGSYFVCYSRSTKSNPYKLEFKKGDGKGKDKNGGLSAAAVPAVNDPAVSVTSFQSVIDLNKKISDLEYQVKLLERDKQELQDVIDEYEKDEESTGLNDPEKDSLLNRTGAWIKETASMLAPLMDEHFKLKNREQDLKDAQFVKQVAGQKNGSPVQQLNEAAVYAHVTNYNSLVESGDEKGAENYLMNLRLHEPEVYNYFISNMQQ